MSRSSKFTSSPHVVHASHGSVQLIVLSNAPVCSPAITPRFCESPATRKPRSFPPFPVPFLRWVRLAAPLHRMLDGEKTTTRSSVLAQSIPKSPLLDSFAPHLSIIPTTSPLVHDTYLMAIPSPWSSNHDRLEGGMGPSRVGGTKRFACKKFAVCAAFLVVIGVIWLFRPRAHTLSWRGNEKADSEVEGKFHCLSF